MPTTSETLLAIAMMALLVYTTRIGGYVLGLQVRHIGRLRPVLEALPGCAIMAILVPAVRRGSLLELIALSTVIGIMWITDSVALASVIGLGMLFFGSPLLALISG